MVVHLFMLEGFDLQRIHRQNCTYTTLMHGSLSCHCSFAEFCHTGLMTLQVFVPVKTGPY